MTQCTAMSQRIRQRLPTMSKRVNMSEKWVTYPRGPLSLQITCGLSTASCRMVPIGRGIDSEVQEVHRRSGPSSQPHCT